MKMKARVKKHSLKLFSVFLSVFLWIYVLNSEKVKFEKTVTLEYVLPDDMLFAGRPLHEVIFMIEGPRAFVRAVAEREDKLILDLNRLNPKRQLEFSVEVLPNQLNLPFGMAVERVLPRKIPIRLEKKASRIVPVKLATNGSLPPGISMIKSEVRPAEVEVYGPRSQIIKLKEIQVRPIDLENLVGQNEYSLEPVFGDERFTLAPGQDLKLHYELKARESNLVLKDVPIRFLTKNKEIPKSSAKTVTVKLLVPPKIKQRSDISSSIQIWADVPPGAWGRVEVPLKSIVPPGIHLLEIVPKSIIVIVE